jgi:hypothetical protein
MVKNLASQEMEINARDGLACHARNLREAGGARLLSSNEQHAQGKMEAQRWRSRSAGSPIRLEFG